MCVCGSVRAPAFISKLSLGHRGQGETSERSRPSGWVGRWPFEKQGNYLAGLVLSRRRTRGCPHPPARIWKVIRRSYLASVTYMAPRSATTYSQSCVLENGSLRGMAGETCSPRMGRGEQAPIAPIQLMGRLAVTSFPWPPPEVKSTEKLYNSEIQ